MLLVKCQYFGTGTRNGLEFLQQCCLRVKTKSGFWGQMIRLEKLQAKNWQGDELNRLRGSLFYRINAVLNGANLSFVKYLLTPLCKME